MKTLLLMLALASGAAWAQDPALAARDASWNTLRQSGDAAALARIIDDRFVLVHSDGRVQHKGDYLAELSSRKRVNGAIRNAEVRIREYGDAAVVNGISVQSAVSDGKPWRGTFRFTRVWIKRQGEWMLVSSHSSRVAEAAQ